MFTRTRHHPSMQSLVKQFQIPAAIVVRSNSQRGDHERTNSMGSTIGQFRRPASRGGFGLDEQYGGGRSTAQGLGGTHQMISVTRELAFGGLIDGDSFAMRRSMMKTFLTPACLGRTALVLVIFLLATAVYVVRYYERQVELRMREGFERTNPLNESSLDDSNYGLQNETQGFGFENVTERFEIVYN